MFAAAALGIVALIHTLRGAGQRNLGYPWWLGANLAMIAAGAVFALSEQWRWGLVISAASAFSALSYANGIGFQIRCQVCGVNHPSALDRWDLFVAYPAVAVALLGASLLPWGGRLNAAGGTLLFVGVGLMFAYAAHALFFARHDLAAHREAIADLERRITS